MEHDRVIHGEKKTKPICLNQDESGWTWWCSIVTIVVCEHLPEGGIFRWMNQFLDEKSGWTSRHPRHQDLVLLRLVTAAQERRRRPQWGHLRSQYVAVSVLIWFYGGVDVNHWKHPKMIFDIFHWIDSTSESIANYSFLHVVPMDYGAIPS